MARGNQVIHVDVAVVGAGISGVGGAWHLKSQCPDRSFLVLEEQESFGGTWITHKYPGIRSDSDLYTFGYRFKSWVGKPIATADQILRYMSEVIHENGLASHIRYRHRILSADWSSADNRWTLEAERTDTGERLAFTAGFLWMCQGYYRHSKGYTPDWPGTESFVGRIVHPQAWPDDLDLKGKRVVCIGSGATAATLIPNIADDCAHVTLLQRSPTFFIPGRNVNELVETLKLLEIDESWIHEIARRAVLHELSELNRRSFEDAETLRHELLEAVRAFLPEDQVQRHFNPRYRPWQQRIAFIPDGDLLAAIRDGKASVVTDEIDRFTPGGIRLKSGEELEADVIVTATGFDLCMMGDIAFAVDGVPVDWSQTVNYRGMMFTGVPNLVWVMGYFRASWTLRVDLLGDFVCRLLSHMQDKRAARVDVRLRPEDADMPLLDWIDPENFNPGYLARGMHLLPRRGDKPEWMHNQDYWREAVEIPAIDLDGAEFLYDGQACAPDAYGFSSRSRNCTDA
jgi:cation diffusion facilitator CzcD-associated flavoprotein CzcO